MKISVEELSFEIEGYDPGIGVDSTVTENTGLRWEYQTKRDEVLFHKAWFADFTERWKRDLYTERLNFQARMDAL